eukprot:TRINITY_DN638_c0_g2_i6.p1 TRINITY_DN638_c0_g2~~TRINITY_DN638_c0_g2_i6.p1  ORF type:complete len:684 (-),score=121.83 TRINITY_DN638_c0_g2_i6:1489-3540(-)
MEKPLSFFEEEVAEIMEQQFEAMLLEKLKTAKFPTHPEFLALVRDYTNANDIGECANRLKTVNDKVIAEFYDAENNFEEHNKSPIQAYENIQEQCQKEANELYKEHFVEFNERELGENNSVVSEYIQDNYESLYAKERDEVITLLKVKLLLESEAKDRNNKSIINDDGIMTIDEGILSRKPEFVEMIKENMKQNKELWIARDEELKKYSPMKNLGALLFATLISIALGGSNILSCVIVGFFSVNSILTASLCYGGSFIKKQASFLRYVIRFFSLVNLGLLVHSIIKGIQDKVYGDDMFEVSQAFGVIAMYTVFLICSFIAFTKQELDRYDWYPVKILWLRTIFVILSSGIMFGVYSVNADSKQWACVVYGVLIASAIDRCIIRVRICQSQSLKTKQMCLQIAERVIHPSVICIVSFALYRNWSSFKDAFEDFYIWSGVIALNYILGSVCLSLYSRISSHDRFKKKMFQKNLLLVFLTLSLTTTMAGALSLYAFPLKSIAIVYLSALTIFGGFLTFLYAEEHLPNSGHYLSILCLLIGFTVSFLNILTSIVTGTCLAVIYIGLVRFKQSSSSTRVRVLELGWRKYFSEQIVAPFLITFLLLGSAVFNNKEFDDISLELVVCGSICYLILCSIICLHCDKPWLIVPFVGWNSVWYRNIYCFRLVKYWVCFDDSMPRRYTNEFDES